MFYCLRLYEVAPERCNKTHCLVTLQIRGFDTPLAKAISELILIQNKELNRKHILSYNILYIPD